MLAEMYITDASGVRCWRTSVTYGFHQGERRNLEHRLALAKAGKVSRLDPATARLVIEIDGQPEPDVSDDELLRELLS